MQTFGAADLLVLLVFVALVLDSRRLRSLARSKRRGRLSATGQSISSGANPDRAGLTLRDIQMRRHVDWADGGLGWEGPEILPADESEGLPRRAPSTTSSSTATRPPATTAA